MMVVPLPSTQRYLGDSATGIVHDLVGRSSECAVADDGWAIEPDNLAAALAQGFRHCPRCCPRPTGRPRRGSVVIVAKIRPAELPS